MRFSLIVLQTVLIKKGYKVIKKKKKEKTARKLRVNKKTASQDETGRTQIKDDSVTLVRFSGNRCLL